MPVVAVEALPQYDALFSNEDGWTGGDGVHFGRIYEVPAELDVTVEDRDRRL